MEDPKEKPELQEALTETDPRFLLSQALYYLNYYTSQETDLSPVRVAEELIAKALTLIPETPTDIRNKEFEVLVVTRADLIEQGFDETVVLALSDEDMQSIAKKMGDAHVEYGDYWGDLQNAVEQIFGIEARDETFVDGEDCLGL